MNSQRLSSLDAITMPEWRWAPFLAQAIKALSLFKLEPYLVPSEFLQKEGLTGSKSNPSKVMTQTWACKTQKLNKVRAVCLEAGSFASVLNFVIKPSPLFDLPFFGADLVTLSSGHLLAIDLQPVVKCDKAHTSLVWKKLIPLWEKWQVKLPSGGAIPEEAKDYFSPGFLWTRLPLGDDGDRLIAEVIRPAYNDYLTLYLDLVKNAKRVSTGRSTIILEGQKRYISYRSEKDPARLMLTRFYGKEWTESYIHEVLFDL